MTSGERCPTCDQRPCSEFCSHQKYPDPFLAPTTDGDTQPTEARPKLKIESLVRQRRRMQAMREIAAEDSIEQFEEPNREVLEWVKDNRVPDMSPPTDRYWEGYEFALDEMERAFQGPKDTEDLE